MDATQGSSASTSLLGPLNGKFIYKKNEDGTINKNAVICSFCKKEFSYHRSCSSLTYHLNAKHVGASPTASQGAASASTLRQPTLAEFGRRVSKATTEKLTNSIAKWVAADCRPISVVEDKGLKEAFQIALADTNFQLPSRTTVMKRIHQLYCDERNIKEEMLAGACHVALAGDHWTSVSDHNYLGVTTHLSSEWKLKSFALTVSKTVTCHYADACAEQFDAVAKEWEIENKVTTIATDSARNMVAAARQLPFEHIPCAAHMLQRTITVCLQDSSFDTALAKCRKIVGHFKHSPASTEELHQQQTALGQAREPLVQDVSTRGGGVCVWFSATTVYNMLLKTYSLTVSCWTNAVFILLKDGIRRSP